MKVGFFSLVYLFSAFPAFSQEQPPVETMICEVKETFFEAGRAIALICPGYADGNAVWVPASTPATHLRIPGRDSKGAIVNIELTDLPYTLGQIMDVYGNVSKTIEIENFLKEKLAEHELEAPLSQLTRSTTGHSSSLIIYVVLPKNTTVYVNDKLADVHTSDEEITKMYNARIDYLCDHLQNSALKKRIQAFRNKLTIVAEQDPLKTQNGSYGFNGYMFTSKSVGTAHITLKVNALRWNQTASRILVNSIFEALKLDPDKEGKEIIDEEIQRHLKAPEQ